MRILSRKTLEKPLKWTLLSGISLTALSLLVSATQATPELEPGLRGPREWVGAIHAHTVASDGGGTLAELAEAAARAGLDFVTITDHNRWGAPASYYAQDVLMLVGEEARVPAGHMLVLGGDAPAVRQARRARAEAAGAPLGRSVPQGTGLRIAAHPEGPSTRWRAWDEPDLDALEIWNWDTDLRDDGLLEWPAALLTLPWKPTAAYLRLVDRPDVTLARWDSLLGSGRVLPGVCSLDAHANVELGPLSLAFPAYEDLFRLARQHVLLPAAPPGDAEGDAALVIRALREGRSYCAIDAVADGSGLTVAVHNGTTTVGLGGTLPLSEHTTLSADFARAPSAAEFILYHNGAEVERVRGPRFTSQPLQSPGAYRLEVVVHRRGRELPWIFTNPIWASDPVTLPSRPPPGPLSTLAEPGATLRSG